jgi:ABC-2 type transport system permease protein
MTQASAVVRQGAYIAGELRKVPAFLRRDLLVTLSYRAAFVADLLGLLTQVVLFYYVGKMVDSDALPVYDGTQATYLEFVVVGIAVGVFLQIGLLRVSAAVRQEQLMGTLESLLATPTSTTTIQLGSAAFDLVYIPLRTAIFLGAMVAAFGLDFHADGLLPALAVLLVFIPFMWGVGLLGAAAMLTFKRGAGVAGLAGTLLALGSGSYFPIDLLPAWVVSLNEVNPVAITLEGMRSALIGGGGWPSLGHDLAVVSLASVASLGVGLAGFGWALARERRLGTLGMY